MTSNQIAYIANVETNRHNVASEELASQSNAISADKNRIQEEYNRRVLDIQERYNNAYLEMQNAQGQRKLDLQEQLNWIEFERTNAESAYKSAMADVANRNQQTEARKQLELERYQKVLNDIGYTKNAIDAQLANIRAKEMEYNKYFNEQEVRIQDFNALTNRIKTQQEYEVQSIRNEIEQVRNEMNYELQQYKQAQMVTTSIWDGVKSIAGLMTGRR